MTGVRLPYLERRQGIWNLRVRVPVDIHSRVGLREVRRSLGTRSAERAQLKAVQLIARLLEVFRMARLSLHSKDDLRGLVESCFADLAGEAESWTPRFGNEVRDEINDQRRMIDDRIEDLRLQIRSGQFDPGVHALASSLIGRAEPGFEVPDGVIRDLAEGVARALAEQQRLYEFRLSDRLLPYTPSDALFAVGPLHGHAPGPSVAATAPTSVAVGPTVQQALNLYLKVKRRAWAVKTPRHRALQLSLLAEHLGQETRLSAVTKDDVRAYRDGVARFRLKHHVGGSQTFIGRQTDAENKRIAPRTAQIHLQNARSFLRWAVAEGYLESDPSAGLKVELPKTSKTKKVRRPFSSGELATLFQAPTFQGCKSPRRRCTPGTMVIRDAQFWLPLLGYYTGARMGELVQIHVADVHIDAPLPFIAITDEGGGELGSGTEKHVKSSAGIRQVPIHPHLLQLGFGDFVGKRRTDKRVGVRLFFEMAFGRDGQASSPYSKQFGRLLDKIGLTDRALCFHSFRHGVEDALREAKEPQYVIDRIIGHSDASVSYQYGQGVSLETATAAVSGMKLPVDVREILT